MQNYNSKLKILRKQFYNRPTLIVARELLGKYIVRKIGRKKLVGKIVEVEAYNGPRDLASHASRGMTERNAVMFGQAGHAYVYFIYGMYYCFNVVTENHGYPAAVLIRAVEPALKTLDVFKRHRASRPATNGPAKFCRAFKIDKSLNGVDITKNGVLWIEDKNNKVKKTAIVAVKRIGVDYAGKYKDKKWRFYIKDNEWVSFK